MTARSMILVKCDLCGAKHAKRNGHYNRSKKLGLKTFCTWECFSESRRLHKTKDQKKAEKSAYDKAYRASNKNNYKERRAASFKKNYKLRAEHFRELRKKLYPKHLEYIRRPEYKEWKKKYDTLHCSKDYGPMVDAHQALLALEVEIKRHMTKYEIRLKNKTLNKTLIRSRNGQVKRSYT